MDVIYYYYYLFYSKIFKDDDPALQATLALSASESFMFIFFVAEPLFLHWFNSFSTWIFIGIIFIITYINWYYYIKLKKHERVVENKPKFFNNHFLTIIIVAVFFIISVTWFFWGADPLW